MEQVDGQLVVAIALRQFDHRRKVFRQNIRLAGLVESEKGNRRSKR
jgi:hypothetical protein